MEYKKNYLLHSNILARENLTKIEGADMYKSSSLVLSRVEQMKKVQEEGLELFANKNKDYGDAFATYGAVGVIVRMGDKIQRLLSINNSVIQLINNESLRDTLIDLHNYAAMAVLLLDEKSVL
jgi:hypothetical protein